MPRESIRKRRREDCALDWSIIQIQLKTHWLLQVCTSCHVGPKSIGCTVALPGNEGHTLGPSGAAPRLTQMANLDFNLWQHGTFHGGQLGNMSTSLILNESSRFEGLGECFQGACRKALSVELRNNAIIMRLFS